MNTAKILQMQPLRAAAFRQPMMRQSILRQTRPLHSSRMMMREKMEGGDQSAHTITARIKSLKKIPPELLPLGVVIAFALFAACFAMGKKLFTDRTLRLHKSVKSPQQQH